MINVKDLNQMARNIIKNNQYVSIATTDKLGNPWISPVAYSYDKNWNLYFTSLPDSKHCKNIKATKKVVCCIFDSHQLWGEGVGLQIEGVSEEVTLRNAIEATKIYSKRKYPYGKIKPGMIKFFLKELINKRTFYRFYKITPRVVWMNDPNSKIDIRVKINLKS